jgi:phospholipid transport system substrate-binding protein
MPRRRVDTVPPDGFAMEFRMNSFLPPRPSVTVVRRALWWDVLMYGGLVLAACWSLLQPAYAADESADVFIKRVSSEILDTIKTDKSIRNGDVQKIGVLVDQRVMPHVNFQRMTAAAVGPGWRQASPEQQKRLQDEFKTLLIRTYAGALSQVSDQTISVKPLRAAPDDKEVVVRTEVRGKGDPIQLDYRVEKAPDAPAGWKIYNLNVMGIWLVDNYRSQFAQEVNNKGVDGLIASLSERNQANRKADGK